MVDSEERKIILQISFIGINIINIFFLFFIIFLYKDNIGKFFEIFNLINKANT